VSGRFLRLLGAFAVLAGSGVVAPAPEAEAAAVCRPPPVRAEPDVPWAQRLLAPERTWSTTRGAGVVVAVVDTGVDATSPQLAGAVAPGVDTSGDAAGTADTDCLGHGTFVAGIIAARPAPGTGFAGVAPAATILPIRDTNTEDHGFPANMAGGIRAAADAGARVINVSASTNADDPALRAAVVHAQRRDCLVVAAAANNAERGNPTPYPASYPGVLAVGAVDHTGAPAAFSQTGGFLGLVAPGVDVISTGPGGPGQWQQSGTSFATPFVSGAAALVRSYRPELSAAEVEQRLEATATRPAAPVPDPAMGWGTVNPYAAVTAVLSGDREAARGGGQPPTPPEQSAQESGTARVVLLCAAGTGGLVFLAAGAAALSPGARRRWRRRRITVVDSAEDA
jgi:type VII secretion-associated serine protease mycosin